MTAYRDDAPSLRAECERLTREVVRLRAPARRWRVTSAGAWWLAVANTGATALWAVNVAGAGWTPANIGRVALNVVAWALWALTCVRRVPVEGARS